MMVCLEEGPLPMKLKSEKEKISIQQKLELIKIIHGSFESADDIILKLREKMPEISKYQIKLHMSEISQKEKG